MQVLPELSSYSGVFCRVHVCQSAAQCTKGQISFASFSLCTGCRRRAAGGWEEENARGKAGVLCPALKGWGAPGQEAC